MQIKINDDFPSGGALIGSQDGNVYIVLEMEEHEGLVADLFSGKVQHWSLLEQPLRLISHNEIMW